MTQSAENDVQTTTGHAWVEGRCVNCGAEEPRPWAETCRVENGEHRPNACCDYHRHIVDGCCHCENQPDPVDYDAAAVAGHEFNWQTGYCACGWAGPAIDEVPRAHAKHVATCPIPPGKDDQ